jgi:leader peptidase (prepilin peptidase)/N-methyltransferase
LSPEMLQDPRVLLLLGAGGLALGMVVGSFLNVVIYRLPRGESVVSPGSHCPNCDAAIRPWDNIPVFSYLLLRGRCRSCGVGISARYPAVEFFTGCVFATLALRFGPIPETLLWMAFAAALIAAAVIDIDHQIIPDSISLGGLLIGLLLVPPLLFWRGHGVADAALHSVGGALLGGWTLWSVGFFHARVCAALGREFEHWPGEGEELPRATSLDYWIWFPGLGFGDVKLMAMIGAFLGPFGVMETIVAASALGLVMGVGWLALKRGMGTPFGFGPALGFGALLAVLLPEHLVVLLARSQGG